MDYSEGTFNFTVSDKSRFMELYLSKDEYSKYYGLPSSCIIQSFASEEEVQGAIDQEQDIAKRIILQQKLHAYRRMREQIIEFAKKLNKNVFIVNPDIIDENDIDLYEYYGVTEETLAGLNKDDLFNGFIMGLQSINAIISYKEKHGSLEIKTDLENRD